MFSRDLPCMKQVNSWVWVCNIWRDALIFIRLQNFQGDCWRGGGKKEESKDAADAAGLLEKLSVGDSKTEEKEKQAKELSQTVADKAKEDGEKEDEPAPST